MCVFDEPLTAIIVQKARSKLEVTLTRKLSGWH